MTKKHVYVAGPYTRGDVVENVRAAVFAGSHIARLGMTPFVPHLYHLWHTVEPQPYEFWMALDLAWLARCDALYRLPGESAGASREEEEAARLGLPVFHRVGDLVVWANAALRAAAAGRGE